MQTGEDPHQERFRLPPEAVADVIRHAIEADRPRTRYPVTVPAHLGIWMRKWISDRMLDRILLNRWKKMAGAAS